MQDTQPRDEAQTLAEQTIVGRLAFEEQQHWASLARDVVQATGLIEPTAGSQAMSVRIANAGALGWVADSKGYRYTATNPGTGEPWPPIPPAWRELADRVAGVHPWDCAHLVWYRRGAALGWHRDKTEAQRLPIITVSLGDEAIWKVRRHEESPITETRLVSGDIVLLSGPTRNALHTIAKVEAAGMFAPSPLLSRGRLAISLRVAGPS